ncbi:MAG: tetratricopeptide repeat protein [Bacteroidales bacterium]
MNTLRKILLFTLLISFFSSPQALAQTGAEEGSKFGSGKDSIRCLRNLSLYVEYYKQNNYEDAIEPWKVVYNECPKASKNIYLHGENMLEETLDNSDDPDEKEELLDSLMHLYDKRIKYFGQEGYVTGKKGLGLVEYGEESAENLKKAYELLGQAIDMRGEESSAAVLVNYMNIANSLHENDIIEDKQILDDYSKTYELVDIRLEEEPDHKMLKRAKNTIDEIFENSDAATCDNLISLYKPRFEENKEEIETVNKIIRLLTDAKCTDSDLYLNANIQLNKLEPDAGVAEHISQLFLERDNLDKTIEYYKKAIDISDNDTNKAEFYTEMATLIYNKKEEKVTARDYAREAIDLNPDDGRPYILIGRMYAESAEECGEDEFEQKAVLWAAVDKFVEAKEVDSDIADEAQGYIDSYRPRFPDKKSIFFQNYEMGDTYEVGCWINEETTVRTSE